MNGTETCPKCNSALDPEFRGPWWICGSHEIRGQLVQSFECKHVERANRAERERDALAAKVAQFVEALSCQPDEAMTMARMLTDSRSKLSRENVELKQRVKRLEEAGDKIVDAVRSVQDWNGTYAGDTMEEWREAKENKT